MRVWDPVQIVKDFHSYRPMLEYSVSVAGLTWLPEGTRLPVVGKPMPFAKEALGIRLYEADPAKVETSLCSHLLGDCWQLGLNLPWEIRDADEHNHNKNADVEAGDIPVGDILVGGHVLHWPVHVRNASVRDATAGRGVIGHLLVPVAMLSKPFAAGLHAAYKLEKLCRAKRLQTLPEFWDIKEQAEPSRHGSDDIVLGAALLKMFWEYESSGVRGAARLDFNQCRWDESFMTLSESSLPPGCAWDPETKSYEIKPT